VTALGAGEGANFGGTRLHQSFALFLGPFVTPDERLTRLLAHELMHEWIGGRLRAGVEPEALMYWWTEGFTDFFAERVLWRAGLLDDSAYARALSAAWRELAFSPARYAPFDSVAGRFWSDDAAQRLPYLRGHLFAVALDDRVRTATAGRSSLETVVGSLVAGAGADGRAMTDSVLAAALAPALGDSAAPLIARQIRDGAPLPAPDTLLDGCFVRHTDSLAPFALGFDLDRSATARRLTGVDSAGPAFAAGMRDGQVLRGWSVRRGDVSQDAEFVVEADGVRRTVRYRPMGTSRVAVPQYTPGTRCPRAAGDGHSS
jgi:predicted metalloprotease with PDZ domain